MTILQLQNVSVAWTASSPLFDSVSLTLHRGFYGLVGANGAGKTTLLSIFARERKPSDGTVTITPSTTVVAFCRQVVDQLDDSIERLAAREDGFAAELRGRLALDSNGLERWQTLSPGERKRWQIAAALAREPEILLLDEPTNHLDIDARKRLLGTLKRFAGLGVIVSHDRTVLDELTTETIRIYQHKVTRWPGRFSEAKILWEQARAKQIAMYGDARNRVRRAEIQLDTARRTQVAASKNVSAGRRMKDKNDSDARSPLANTKSSWAASKAGRVAASARTQLDRAQKAIPSIERDTTLGARVFASFQRAHSPVLFHIDEEEVRRGDHAILYDVHVTIGREDRIRIEGANGAGKTTLLEALITSNLHRDRLLYLPQELTQEAKAMALERLRASNPEERGRTLSIFAALGSEPERILQAEAAHLSPGEARKLVLARALSQQVWALVLDEPTNHMDLPSIEQLEIALSEYPGAVVLVTHDDLFAAKVTTRSLRVEYGTVILILKIQ